jgi:hypothetical protein
MKRSYYSFEVADFLAQNSNQILGEIVSNCQFSVDDTQKNAWIKQIEILKRELSGFTNAWILFEYTIPRMGKRIDNVLIYKGLIFILEFKVGEHFYSGYAIDQVLDYAMDLKNFHKESHNKIIVPILIATKAPIVNMNWESYPDNILKPILSNGLNLQDLIHELSGKYGEQDFSPADWENSVYMPTPTIIEAAQALYQGHNVKEISRSDSGAMNLTKTTEAINSIIDKAKLHNEKAICFITGVPGSGKTLAGLNIANVRHSFDENEHAVFLSGNGPLVAVLQEALARDQHSNSNKTISKKEALEKSKTFIQLIHHFRDEALMHQSPPFEKVAIFDEAQRAWDMEQTSNFMKNKKGKPDFCMSEPEFLISVMDRHPDWAVIVCLIGEGQEINTGEAGLSEWFKALYQKYGDWNVYLSSKILSDEFVDSKENSKILENLNCEYNDDLHLSVSIRSFRSEQISSLVASIIDVNLDEASRLYAQVGSIYPIAITRDLSKAKQWVKTMARGSERYGLIASSGAARLKTDGIWVQYKIDAKNWFLNGKDDVRSSYYLEDAATQFDIQGLELDWTIVAWDADFRFFNGEFIYQNFVGTKWQNINKESNRIYLKNTYRVLLTRARQGMVIFIPEGNDEDATKSKNFYDGTYNYLKEIGIKEI